MKLKELINSFFNEDLECFIDKQPFIGFIILSVMLEAIAKIYSKNDIEVETKGMGHLTYLAIENLASLQKYRHFHIQNEGKSESNYLYTRLRCGMVHSLIPKGEILLNKDKNDIEKNVVGAKDLYMDLKNAWEEIKNNEELKEYLEKDVLNITESLSANTITSMVRVIN